MSDIPVFKFQVKWKEELVISSPDGSFSIEFTMGNEQRVNYPTKDLWEKKAPEWAKKYWDEIYLQLEEWCQLNHASLHIIENAYLFLSK